MKATIHCNPLVPWQKEFAPKAVQGLRKCGVPAEIAEITDGHERRPGTIPVLLGTTFWRAIEADGGPFLLVDRCSFNDTNKFVSLVWNGHGRRGVHPMPQHTDASRWERIGTPVKPWQPNGARVVLCGQSESYSPLHPDLEEWYRGVPATHFRPHPAGSNPTGLPQATDFTDAVAVTLNSSIGVQCVLDGVPTLTMDPGAMAWSVTGHQLGQVVRPNRDEWLHWLAWTQWSHDEIANGEAWNYVLY